MGHLCGDRPTARTEDMLSDNMKYAIIIAIIAYISATVYCNSEVCDCLRQNDSGRCDVEITCERWQRMATRWLKSVPMNESEVAEMEATCDGRRQMLFPHPRHPLVYQIIKHHLLQAIQQLMTVWKRKTGLFLIDKSSGIEPSIAKRYFQHNEINSTFVYVSEWTLGHLREVYRGSENVVICCNERMTDRILNETNRLGMFDSTYTWIVSDHNTPPVFQSITLLPKTSLTFFQFSLKQQKLHFKIDRGDKVPIDFNCTNLPQSNTFASISLILAKDEQLSIVIKQVQEFFIYDVFFGYHRNTLEMVQFGTWTATNGLRLIEHFEAKDGQLRLRGKLLRATLFEHQPYSYMSHTGDNRTLVVFGYMKDVYDMLMTTLNFRYVIKEVPPIFGIGTNGTYTGFVGVLYRKEAEVAMNVLAYTNSRSTGVRYTGPLTRGYLSICYNRPKPFVPPTTYWMPFELDVWVLILVTLIVLMLAIGLGVIISPGSHRTQTPSKAFHTPLYRIVTGTFFEEALENPPGLTSKIIYGALLWATMMVFNHYTSVFTSFLTLLEIKIPFNDLEDVIKTKDYLVLYVNNTRHQDMFQNAKDGLFADVWRKITSGSDSVSDFGSGLLKMYQGKYVYLTEGPTTLALAANNCSVSFASKTYIHEFFYLTTRNDFPYAKLFNLMLLKIMESGIMNRLATVYSMHKRPPCVVESSSQSLGLEQTVGLYVLFAFGMSLAFIALLIERTSARKYIRDTVVHVNYPDKSPVRPNLRDATKILINRNTHQ